MASEALSGHIAGRACPVVLSGTPLKGGVPGRTSRTVRPSGFVRRFLSGRTGKGHGL